MLHPTTTLPSPRTDINTLREARKRVRSEQVRVDELKPLLSARQRAKVRRLHRVRRVAHRATHAVSRGQKITNDVRGEVAARPRHQHKLVRPYSTRTALCHGEFCVLEAVFPYHTLLAMFAEYGSATTALGNMGDTMVVIRAHLRAIAAQELIVKADGELEEKEADVAHDRWTQTSSMARDTRDVEPSRSRRSGGRGSARGPFAPAASVAEEEKGEEKVVSVREVVEKREVGVQMGPKVPLSWEIPMERTKSRRPGTSNSPPSSATAVGRREKKSLVEEALETERPAVTVWVRHRTAVPTPSSTAAVVRPPVRSTSPLAMNRDAAMANVGRVRARMRLAQSAKAASPASSLDVPLRRSDPAVDSTRPDTFLHRRPRRN
jgi:hypothetical protein